MVTKYFHNALNGYTARGRKGKNKRGFCYAERITKTCDRCGGKGTCERVMQYENVCIIVSLCKRGMIHRYRIPDWAKILIEKHNDITDCFLGMCIKTRSEFCYEHKLYEVVE